MARVELPPVAVVSAKAGLQAAIAEASAALALLGHRAGQLDPDAVAELTVLVHLLAHRLKAAIKPGSPLERQGSTLH